VRDRVLAFLFLAVFLCSEELHIVTHIERYRTSHLEIRHRSRESDLERVIWDRASP